MLVDDICFEILWTMEFGKRQIMTSIRHMAIVSITILLLTIVQSPVSIIATAPSSSSSSELCDLSQSINSNDSCSKVGKVGTYDATSLDVMLADVLGRELNAHFHELGAISDSDEYLTRRFMTPAWHKATVILKEWMQDAGLDVWMDEIGNIRGRTPASVCVDSDAPALVMGSHFDTGMNISEKKEIYFILHACLLACLLCVH